ncbi:MAG: hypothetical protein EOS27_27680 [Mesorhizobium sp.]|nr:MAG: hypothetical protein EOS27_27680 [Mesorhizobium sp.]TIX23302.1 MAG: hypothetical protein E5V35_22720 [Mesorhizobium sp.]
MSRLSNLQVHWRLAKTVERVISHLEGEMSPKATEGVGPTGRDFLRLLEASAPGQATPSALPGISPSRGEISHRLPIPSHPRQATGARRP